MTYFELVKLPCGHSACGVSSVPASKHQVRLKAIRLMRLFDEVPQLCTTHAQHKTTCALLESSCAPFRLKFALEL